MELILKAKDIRVEFKGRDVLDIEALELGNKKIDELRKEINNINTLVSTKNCGRLYKV